MFYVFAVIYGFGYGGLDTPVAALLGDVFGLRNLGMIMGTLVIGWGIGAAVGPAVGGFLFDVNGSYSIAFLIGALAMMVAAFFVALIRRKW